MSNRMYIAWVDADGRTRLTAVNTASGGATILAQLTPLSQSAIANHVDAPLSVVASPAPPGGMYRTVNDCAALIYQDASGDLTRIQLPAPSASIFKTDGFTVDPAQITALTNAIVGSVITAAGGVVTSFLGGSRLPTTRESY